MSNELLQAINNIIELKTDKRYLFVFKGAEQSNIDYVWARLTKDGVQCSCIALPEGQDLSVIEYPMPEQPASGGQK